MLLGGDRVSLFVRRGSRQGYVGGEEQKMGSCESC